MLGVSNESARVMTVDWKLVVINARAPEEQSISNFTDGLEAMHCVHVNCCHSKQMQQLEFQDPNQTLKRTTIHQLARKNGIDVFIYSDSIKQRKLLVADMEATIIEDEMLDLLAEERGVGDEVAAITERAMAGKIDFAESLIERTKLLAGTPESLLKTLCTRMHYSRGARALVHTMSMAGARTVLVTGGYGIFANEVARECNFDQVIANNPVLHRGTMTGKLRGPICTAKTKRDVLLRCCEALDITPDSACCIGDGANDTLMLQTGGLAVSYRGKPVVQGIVDLNITTGDLTAALLAQGFTPSEILNN